MSLAASSTRWLAATSIMIMAALIPASLAQMAHGGHGGSDHSGVAVKAGDACVTSPTLANCTTYSYPLASAAADLKSLCGAMPFMAACSVAKACAANGAGPDSPTAPGAANVSSDPAACEPFNLVATICRHDDMSTMKGCANYNSMCADGSKVAQCTDMPGLTSLPTTRQLNEQVRAVCEAMPHTGCELCLPSWKANQTWGNCDLLAVYGSVCGEMPDMAECEQWTELCTADPGHFVCSAFPTGKQVLMAAGSGNMTGNATAAPAPAPAKSGAMDLSFCWVLLTTVVAAVAALACL